MDFFLLPVNEYCPHKSNKERRKTNGNQTNIGTIAQGQSAGEESLLQLLWRQLPASGRRRYSRLRADQFVQQYHVQLLCEMRTAQWRTAWCGDNTAAELQTVRVLRCSVCTCVEQTEVLPKLLGCAGTVKRRWTKTAKKNYAMSGFRGIKSA